MFIHKLPKSLTALLEVGILFLPAIPAYLWIWPNIEGAALEAFQIIVYVYVIAGTLYIGLRRWRLAELGVNLKGFWVSLGSSLAILLGRLMIVLSIYLGLSKPVFTPLQFVLDILYYFALVGLGEELLFRGLVYHALQEWHGVRWAIWGSSFGFMLWHIFGQGAIIGVTTFFFGLMFALIRWRSGSIVWLIILHALFDIETTFILADSNQAILAAGRPAIPHPVWTFAGLGLMIATPLVLWLVYPKIMALMKKRITGNGISSY